MGEIIRFPQERRELFAESYRPEPAMILILPTVRIEREIERQWMDLLSDQTTLDFSRWNDLAPLK